MLVMGYVISGLAKVNLPYYVYLLPSSGSHAVKWGDWLRVNFAFNWNYNGINYSTGYTAKLNIHSADIAGQSETFSYLGADGVINLKDLGLITGNWQKSWTNTPPP